MTRRMRAFLAISFFAAILVCPVISDGCSDLGDDLACSACNNFVDQFFVFVSKAPSALVKKGSSTNNLWHDGNKMALAATVPKIYSQRIKDLYKSHAPDKVSGVSDLMKKSKGKEHELYLRICNKYGTDPEEEYLEPSVSDKPLWKYTAGEEAIAGAIATTNKEGGLQWAKTGKEGERAFMDFAKAMNGGTIDNMSMGGDVAEDLKKCFEHIGAEHESLLINTVAESSKPYSSGLHKTFCKDYSYCPATKAKSEL